MAHCPKVSVIIPVYNVEKYLARCLDSVLGQSFHYIEVLCIDDGSTVSSPEILRRYADRDARIRIITQENQGVSAARNAGLDAAKGEWIAFVDSDDEVMPDIWETSLAEVRDEDAVCFSIEELRIENGKSTPVNSGYFDILFSGRQELKDEDLLSLSMAMCDKLYRRSKVEESALRFPRGLRFEDNVFVMCFFSLHRKVYFVSQKLYRYYRHESSITGISLCRKERLAFDYIEILEPIYTFWNQYKLFPRMAAIFEHCCFSKLRSAIDICQPWERPGIIYALAEKLHRWEIEPQNKVLRAIKEGDLTIRAGFFPGKEITMLKPLRGFQKIFYVGNCQGRKIVCLFGRRIFSWKRKKR